MLLDAPARSRISDLSGSLARAEVMHQLDLEQRLQHADDESASEIRQDLEDSKQAIDDLRDMQVNPQIAGPELESFQTRPSFPPIIEAQRFVTSLIASDARNHAQLVKPPPVWSAYRALSRYRISAANISRRGPPPCA
ncbi:MAG: hypothetical protein ACYTDT_12335 [Planctomycetota bacterium]